MYETIMTTNGDVNGELHSSRIVPSHGPLHIHTHTHLPKNKQKPVPFKGHAIEARVYAEDPLRGFLPSTGQLLTYREPRHLFDHMEVREFCVGVYVWVVGDRGDSWVREPALSLGDVLIYPHTRNKQPTTTTNQSNQDGLPAVRIDTGVYEGAEISMFYDPMISKLITYGAASTRNTTHFLPIESALPASVHPPVVVVAAAAVVF